MLRNIKSIKRENVKRVRYYGEHNLPPKATRSPYFSDEALSETFVQGKIPGKSTRESRAKRQDFRQRTRNERRANRLVIRDITKMTYFGADESLDEILYEDNADVGKTTRFSPVMYW